MRARSGLNEGTREKGEGLRAGLKPSQIAWAHLSDFHFGAAGRGRDCDRGPDRECDRERDRDYDRDAVLDALLDDLRMFAGKSEPRRGAERVPLDFLVITGDVAQGGKAGEYAAAGRFLAELRDAIGIPTERIFLVPGNHDIDRERNAPEFIRRAVRSRPDFKKLWQDPEARRFMLERKLAAYREFAAKLNPALSPGGLPPDQPGGFLHRLEHRGRSVALVGLTSCWLGGDDQDRNSLIVGEDQLFDLAGV